MTHYDEIMTQALRYAVFLAFALPAAIVDAREYRIPDVLSLGGFLAICCVDSVSGGIGALFPGVCGAALGLAVFLLARAATGGLGLGDVKLSLPVGAFLGPAGFIAAMLLASLAGIGYFAYRLVRVRDASEAVPFAPFMLAGALGARWLGGRLGAW